MTMPDNDRTERCECGSNCFYTEDRPPHIALVCSGCNKFIKWVRQPKNQDKRADIPASIRKRVLKAFNYRCVKCNHVDLPLHVDHILSVAQCKKQGRDDRFYNSVSNLQVLCAECNAAKRDEVGDDQVSELLYVHYKMTEGTK